MAAMCLLDSIPAGIIPLTTGIAAAAPPMAPVVTDGEQAGGGGRW